MHILRTGDAVNALTALAIQPGISMIFSDFNPNGNTLVITDKTDHNEEFLSFVSEDKGFRAIVSLSQVKPVLTSLENIESYRVVTAQD